MSSLNIALFAFQYPCFSVHFCSAITLSFLLLLLFIIPGESDHVSYMIDKSSCSIYPLYAALGHLCVVVLFKDYTQCLIYSLIPSLLYLYLFVSPFFCPVPSHSCDPLEDLLPSLSQHFSAFSTSWWWRPRVLMMVPLDSISSLVNSFASVFNYPFAAYPYSHGLDCTGSLGSFMKTLVPPFGLSCARPCLILISSSQIFEDSSLLYCGFDPPL